MDSDNDHRLNFEELHTLMPRSVRMRHSTKEIRSWFDVADRDGDGILTSVEFFHWVLAAAAQEYGASAIDSLFNQFNADGDTDLDAREFEKLVTPMGFGAAAMTIFRSLDRDATGTVSVRELKDTVLQDPIVVTPEARKDWHALFEPVACLAACQPLSPLGAPRMLTWARTSGHVVST